MSHTERARIHAMNSPLGRAKRGIDGREGGGGPEVHPGQHEPGPGGGPPNPNATRAKILEHQQKDIHLKGFEAKRIRAKRIRSQKDSRPKRIRSQKDSKPKGFEIEAP